MIKRHLLLATLLLTGSVNNCIASTPSISVTADSVSHNIALNRAHFRGSVTLTIPPKTLYSIAADHVEQLDDQNANYNGNVKLYVGNSLYTTDTLIVRKTGNSLTGTTDILTQSPTL